MKFAIGCALAGSLFTMANVPVTLHLIDGSIVSGFIPEDGVDKESGVTLCLDDVAVPAKYSWDRLQPRSADRIKYAYDVVDTDVETIKNGKAEERYGEELQKIDQANVDDQYELALLAHRLALYDRAKSCLDIALALDAESPNADLIRKHIALLVKKRDEAARDDAAVEQAAAEETAAEQATADQAAADETARLARVEREIEAKRAKNRNDAVSKAIRSNLVKRLRNQLTTKTKGLDVRDAMTFATESAFDGAIDQLAGELRKDFSEVTRDELLTCWDNRGAKLSPETASFGSGTFIIYPNQTSGGDREADLWWTNAGSKERESFLLAIFAKYGGRVTLIGAGEKIDCSPCGGRGWTESMKPCLFCKTLGHEMKLKFK